MSLLQHAWPILMQHPRSKTHPELVMKVLRYTIGLCCSGTCQGVPWHKSKCGTHTLVVAEGQQHTCTHQQQLHPAPRA